MAVLNKIRSKIKEIEKQAGFDKTKAEELIKMLQEELDILKKNPKDKSIADHQIMDMQVLLMQLANRYNTDLDSEWKRWLEKSKKYL